MLKKITDAIFGTIIAIIALAGIAYCATMSYHAYQFQAAGVVNGSCAQTPFVHGYGETPRIASDIILYDDNQATKRLGRIEQFQFLKVLAQDGEMVKIVRYYEQENKDAPSYWVKRDRLELAQHLNCHI
jgi:hypothetical protein